MIQARMSQERYSVTDKAGCEILCNLYECDEGELEMLGYNVHGKEDDE